MPDGTDIERVRRVATEVRAFLEPRWEAVRAANGKPLQPGRPISHDMCRLSAAFLARVLEEEMPGTGWTVRGGHPGAGEDIDPESGIPGGCQDAGSGRWHGHYWVSDEAFDLVVDITGDQFGGASVMVEDGPHPRYRGNYAEWAVEEHVRQVRWRVARWREEWREAHAPGWSAEDAGLAAPAPR